MDSMEIDFDLDNDPIKEFLRQKLAEIKSANASLETELKTRNDLLKLSEGKVAELRGALKIKDVWKRVFHSRCIFGIVLENTSSGSFKFVDLVLNWNSSTPLTYTVKSFVKNESNEWIFSDSIRSSATVSVVLEKASFLKQAAFNLEGFIKYLGESREFQLPLAGLHVSAEDFTDRVLEIQRFRLLRGADDEFLSYLVGNDVTEFIGKIVGNGRRTLESLLAIDCMFKQLDVKSGKKKYFLVDGISCNIDGCLLEFQDSVEDGLFYFNVLSRNQEQLKHLLHYLYKNVEGFSMLPKSHESHLRKSFTPANQSFTKDDQEEDKTSKDFRRTLLQEISCVEEFFTDKTKNDEDYATFRNELSELEIQTDVIRAKCDV